MRFTLNLSERALANLAELASELNAEHSDLWEKPGDWTMDDAAAVAIATMLERVTKRRTEHAEAQKRKEARDAQGSQGHETASHDDRLQPADAHHPR